MARKKPIRVVVSNHDLQGLLDTDGAAKFLGVSRWFVIAHLRRKTPTIPHVRLGGNRIVRFRREDLLRFASENAVSV